MASDRQRHRRRHHAGAMVAALVITALLGCVPQGDGAASGPARPAPPSGADDVLSAAEVGGRALDGPGGGLTSACGIDGADTWTGLSDSGIRRFERGRGGSTEVVTIGVWERDEEIAKRHLAELPDRVGQENCNAPGRIEATNLTGFDAPSVAFATELPPGAPAAAPDDAAAEGTRRVSKRAYSVTAGRMVLVWLDRTDGTDPSTRDLRELLDAQRNALGRAPSD